MPCGCGGRRSVSYRGATPNDRPAGLNAAAAQAGAGSMHEVVKSTGAAAGRRFTSLVAAQRYANAIGGTVRPVK